MNPTVKQKSDEQCENTLYGSRIVQIHPTLQCNLACKHCYSSSMPQYKKSLDVSDLKQFLLAAKDHGYNTVSISGGEPFLYKDLSELLQFTKSEGFKNVVASNGMLLGNKSSREALDFVDVIAISIDGKPELHNQIRSSQRAFKKMLDGVEVVKSNKIPFGFIHTVTKHSWNSILWLADFAHQHGAKLLQLHPLEMYGRAVDEMQHFGLNQSRLHKVFVLASYLKSKYQSEMFVQLDLLHKEYIKEFPQSVNILSHSKVENNISDILNTIIVNENGEIVPIGYGFSNRFKIGNVTASGGYDRMFENYMDVKIPLIKRLFQESYEKIIHDEDRDLVNWNELIIKWSHGMV